MYVSKRHTRGCVLQWAWRVFLWWEWRPIAWLPAAPLQCHPHSSPECSSHGHVPAAPPGLPGLRRGGRRDQGSRRRKGERVGMRERQERMKWGEKEEKGKQRILAVSGLHFDLWPYPLKYKFNWRCCHGNILVAEGCSVAERDLAMVRRWLPRTVWSEQSWTSSINWLLLIWGL